METLTFANGQTVNGHCLIASSGVLFLCMEGIRFPDAFALLSNPENFSTIQAYRYSKTTEITGFTHFYTITEEPNGLISAGIKKD